MGRIFVLAIVSAVNPTLLAATTVMLLLRNPKRLLLGYLCGGMLLSITVGLLIVLSLNDSSSASTTRHTLSPGADFTLGGILLLVAFALASGWDRGYRERRRQKKEGKPEKEPRWQKFLNRGRARDTFVVGALLSFPGGTYLAGLDKMTKQDLGTVGNVVAVIVFNLIMFAFLELPLLGYTFAPDRTPRDVDRFKAWGSRHGRGFALYGCAVIGAALVIRGFVGVL